MSERESDQRQLPSGVLIRQAHPSDALAIHSLLRPYVMQRLLLARSEAEVIELTRHGFVAVQNDGNDPSVCVGFSAVEIYSSKLAELQCLAVHPQYQKVEWARRSLPSALSGHGN